MAGLGVSSLAFVWWVLRGENWLFVSLPVFFALVAGVVLIWTRDVRKFSLIMGGFVFLGAIMLLGFFFASPEGRRTPTTGLAMQLGNWCLIGIVVYNFNAAWFLRQSGFWLILAPLLQGLLGYLSLFYVACSVGQGCL